MSKVVKCKKIAYRIGKIVLIVRAVYTIHICFFNKRKRGGERDDRAGN